ncbi:MAG: hypothetical protein ACJAXJ_003912 [Colwellia sp.]|jgi:hypothetical protein
MNDYYNNKYPEVADLKKKLDHAYRSLHSIT